MYADRYGRAPMRPGSLAAAVAINGALIAALLFSAPEILKPPETPFEGYPVNADPPPPLPKPEQRVERAKAPVTDPLPFIPNPRIDLPLPPVNPEIGTIDPPPIPSDPGSGTEPRVTVDPPRPAPVLVDAAPDPRYARDFQPDYPPSERRAGNEGKVTVRLLVGADGRVKEVQRLTAASDAFFDATRRQALARWRFRPATRDGVPHESWRTMTVRFVLEG